MILIVAESLFLIAASIAYVLIEAKTYNSTYYKVLEIIFMAIVSFVQLSAIIIRKRIDSPQSPLKNPSKTIQLENISTFKLKTISACEDTYKIQFQNMPSQANQPKLVRRQLSMFSEKII
ncbi:transmembrane protein, putative (macronuclear) [Tetrahymena thermophila SB210]|uniref:Transmembrane protein, putative n=1 Tax=Tetrahymena thermophila (strain SB210) TaxID=312017 RepID=W7XB27_TETTS|nr:transmembrane protein, putative [Tetrahymena thermophila SB210]EWS76580.1 transmembrane protein, putative [Tetrahymena thermophila SB210]|eukprot:XP_012650866.1 transmembrane protein, putative [Tetrahymena thermophila SB210]